MADPFRIEGPAVVSFSGGRTSGLMLRRTLDVWGGDLPFDVHVLFANTGKEREETLDFVRECGERWGVRIVWLERVRAEGESASFREVDFASASRQGEPFAQLIAERKFPPNPVARYCTQELKVRLFRNWMRTHGYDYWTNIIGLRADEPGRVARIRAGAGRERWDVAVPLADAGITKADVDAFWRAQPFDLRLQSWEGNCDLCFLKGLSRRKRVMEERPELARWWVEQEERTGTTFRADAPPYRALLEATQAQVSMFPADNAIADCICNETDTAEVA